MVLGILMTVFVRLIESYIGKSTRSWNLSHTRVDAIIRSCTYQRCWIIFLTTTKWQVLLVDDVNRKVISLEKNGSGIHRSSDVTCHDFLDRWLLLTRKLLNQGFILVKLKSSLRKFYGRDHDLANQYGISVSQMTMYIYRLS